MGLNPKELYAGGLYPRGIYIPGGLLLEKAERGIIINSSQNAWSLQRRAQQLELVISHTHSNTVFSSLFHNVLSRTMFDGELVLVSLPHLWLHVRARIGEGWGVAPVYWDYNQMEEHRIKILWHNNGQMGYHLHTQKMHFRCPRKDWTGPGDLSSWLEPDTHSASCERHSQCSGPRHSPL